MWVGGGIGAVALLRRHPDDHGAAYVVLCLVLAWIGDTGGYFAGRAFGKHKLYEAVSPKKTMEGAVGGVLATIAGAVIAKLVLQGITIYEDLSAEAYFEDGQLFWGHIVLVAIDSDGEPTDATIAG